MLGVYVKTVPEKEPHAIVKPLLDCHGEFFQWNGNLLTHKWFLLLPPAVHVHVCILHVGPPHKVQCLPDCLIPCQPHSSTAVTGSLPPSTPSRPAVSFGSMPSARYRVSVACKKTATEPSAPDYGEDNVDPCTYGSMPSPPSSLPDSPPLSPLMCSKHLSVECIPHRTPASEGKEGHMSTQSLSEEQLSSQPCTKKSEELLMDRFNTVYHSLTSHPLAEFENEDDGNCDSVLDGKTLTAQSHVVDLPSASKVLTRAPSCPYVTVTGSDGARVYLKLQQQKVSMHNICHCVCRSQLFT